MDPLQVRPSTGTAYQVWTLLSEGPFRFRGALCWQILKHTPATVVAVRTLPRRPAKYVKPVFQ